MLRINHPNPPTVKHTPRINILLSDCLTEGARDTRIKIADTPNRNIIPAIAAASLWATSVLPAILEMVRRIRLPVITVAST